MPDDDGLLAPGGIDQADDIAGQGVDVIGRYPLGLVRKIVSPLVWNNYTITGFGQRFDLFQPSSPKFRETVQQNHRFAIFGASLNHMQIDTVGGDHLMV